MKPLYPLRDANLADRSDKGPVAVKVSVVRAQGSVPRDPGAAMLVTAEQVFDTVGGGHLELEATAKAREILSRAQRCMEPCVGLAETFRFSLGPSLGQCCGGVVWLEFEVMDNDQVAQLGRSDWLTKPILALFGGGHVGEAIAAQMALLQWRVVWIDSREQFQPEQPHPLVAFEHHQPVEDAVADLEPNSRVLIMSFSHAEDLAIVQACLMRQRTSGDLPFIGLIGSATKWASFRHRLTERGMTQAELDHVTCPIGEPLLTGKLPATIALTVAVQLVKNLPDNRCTFGLDSA